MLCTGVQRLPEFTHDGSGGGWCAAPPRPQVSACLETQAAADVIAFHLQLLENSPSLSDWCPPRLDAELACMSSLTPHNVRFLCQLKVWCGSEASNRLIDTAEAMQNSKADAEPLLRVITLLSHMAQSHGIVARRAVALQPDVASHRARYSSGNNSQPNHLGHSTSGSSTLFISPCKFVQCIPGFCIGFGCGKLCDSGN